MPGWKIDRIHRPRFPREFAVAKNCFETRIRREAKLPQSVERPMMLQLNFIDGQAKIKCITTEPDDTRVAAGKQMNLDLATDRARALQTQLKPNGSSLHRRAGGHSEMVRHPRISAVSANYNCRS